MFGSNQKEEEKPTSTETIIGASVKLEGDFKSEGDVTINGEVSGMINTKGDLEIGETAIVKANVEGKNVRVSGKVEGNVKAEEKVEIRTSGEIRGNIQTKSLEIADGAFFSGESKMDGENVSKPSPVENP